MDAPLPPPIVAAAPDCLCKPECKCDPCKCAGPNVQAVGNEYSVTYKDRRWTFTASSREQADALVKELRKLADGTIPQPMPAFVPGNCPGGLCPVR